jgi:hypothetical protein
MDQPVTAICVLRVERDADWVLITMTVTDDIASGHTAVVRRFTDPTAASAAVADFIDAARPLGDS